VPRAVAAARSFAFLISPLRIFSIVFLSEVSQTLASYLSTQSGPDRTASAGQLVAA